MLVTALGTFFAFADYRPRSGAAGQLVTQDGTAKVFPEGNGVVIETFVEDGSVVEAGDPLMVVSYQNSLDGGRRWGEAWLSEAENLIASLERERAMIERSLEAEINIAEQRMNALELGHDLLATELESLQEQLVNARERFAGRERLARQGILSQSALRTEEDELSALQSAVRVKEIEIARNGAEQATLEHQLSQTQQELARAQVQIDREILTTRQLSIERRSQLTQTLAAPIDGRVTTMLASVGSPVSAAAPVMTLLPLWSLLEAEVFVPAAAIGGVSLGQDVDIKFPSFPYQRYGTFDGEVTYISDTTLRPGDHPATAEFQTAVYRLRIDIDEQNVITRDGVFPMLPGMGVEVDLVSQPLSVFDWVMKPIQDVTGRFE
ncbi:HlyD family efflux transporter periplasmic adaptor subunit [Fodinicurvata sp. EGI_FJ10296]|uniref:HlyD family secretion protein n=1 Tax=Fodinicurvata sp. EGI_FJ10296 TaxID=3231908 RepID=UPI0034524728